MSNLVYLLVLKPDINNPNTDIRYGFETKKSLNEFIEYLEVNYPNLYYIKSLDKIKFKRKKRNTLSQW